MQLDKAILSPVFLTLILFGTSVVLDRFELGYGWLRASCLSILWATVWILSFQDKGEPVSAGSNRNLKIFSIFILIILGLTIIPQTLTDIPNGPRCDIGWTTKDAVHVLVSHHQNPYESNWIGKIGEDPRFWGYHYGPGTILSYLPAEFFGEPGVKIINLLYLAAIFMIVSLLIYSNESHSERKAAVYFAMMLLCLPSRLWHETFRQGATDILPVGLILASILALQSKNWLTAGFLAGFSISCKLMPGCLFAALLIRWPINWKLMYGVVLGLVPVILAASWSPEALFNNIVFFHSVKMPDSTSLYTTLPSYITRIFPLFQLVILTVFVINNIRKSFNSQYLVLDLFFLLIAFEITYREIHGNHLLWIFPLVAILFTWGRSGGLKKVSAQSHSNSMR